MSDKSESVSVSARQPQSPPGQMESENVFGDALLSCSEDPVTGFYRDGCCNTGKGDHGSHTICVSLTTAFLEYSRSKGNDLMTPMPAFNFPGLNEGDKWCLCASRWLEAHQSGCAPRVHLRATHKRALDIVPLDILREYAIDLN